MIFFGDRVDEFRVSNHWMCIKRCIEVVEDHVYFNSPLFFVVRWNHICEKYGMFFTTKEMEWKRLEAFARNRGHMHLRRLPCDVLYFISTDFLYTRDILNLVEAFAGRPFDWNDTKYFESVPSCLISSWIVAVSKTRMDDLVNLVSDDAFWFASAYSKTFMYVDWSPFSESPPHPLAAFKWRAAKPHAHIQTFPLHMLQSIQRAFVRGSGCVHVSLYTDCRRGRVQYRPLFTTHFDLVPQFALVLQRTG